MQPIVKMIRLTVLAPAALLSLVVQALSEKINTPYPGMAPIDRYWTPKSVWRKARSEIHFGQRRGDTPQGGRLSDSGQGHEWVRLYRVAILGRGDRRSGVLEPGTGHRSASMHRLQGRICPG